MTKPEEIKNKEEVTEFIIFKNLKKNPDNLVLKSIRYMGTQYDGYMDWNLMGILMNLAIISNKKVRMEFAQQTIYTNLYALSIANSTMSRKSTGMTKHAKQHGKIGIYQKRLPESGSPQRFLEDMSNQSHRYFFKDECAEMFHAMNRKGGNMAELRGILMYLYDCEDYLHALRTAKDKQSEFQITDPYLNCWFITTPDNLKESASKLDLTSGLLYRTLIQYPVGTKTWMGFRSKTDEDIKGNEYLINRQTNLKMLIDASPNIEFKFDDGAFKFYSEWQERREKEIDASGDVIINAIFGRLEPMAIKISMLMKLGDVNLDFEDNNRYKGELTAYVPKGYIEDSCELIDNYFIPNAIRLNEMIGKCKEMEIIEKVKSYVYKYGKVTKSQILRNIDLPSKYITPAIDHLIEAKYIIYLVENNSDSYGTHDVYLRPTNI